MRVELIGSARFLHPIGALNIQLTVVLKAPVDVCAFCSWLLADFHKVDAETTTTSSPN